MPGQNGPLNLGWKRYRCADPRRVTGWGSVDFAARLEGIRGLSLRSHQRAVVRRTRERSVKVQMLTQSDLHRSSESEPVLGVPGVYELVSCSRCCRLAAVDLRVALIELLVWRNIC
jgi:hypothetical protein